MNERERLDILRNKMWFHAYATKDLDYAETQYYLKFGEIPAAYLVRTPFAIVGRKDNLRKLVVSAKYCGANAVFIPRLLSKDELEHVISELGEARMVVYEKRHMLEKEAERIDRETQKANTTYMRHCPYCGVEYLARFDRSDRHCGKEECATAHKEYLDSRREHNSVKVIRRNGNDKTKTPDFSLDDPGHTSLQGYVYMIRAENGLCKIGRSDDVMNRYNTLITMSPVPLILEHTVFSNNYVLAEDCAHEILKEHRHHGEWFDLPEDKEEWFLSLSNYGLDAL